MKLVEFNMTLSIIGTALSLALLALYTPMVVWSSGTRSALLRFPRSRYPGVILTALGLLWAGWHLKRIPLAWLDPIRPWMDPIMIVGFFAIIVYLRELLAVRALGGLLLLLPAVMLDHARFHPSAYRYVIIVMAYFMVIKGIVLICYPYMFRRWVLALGSDRWFTLAGCIGIAFALSLLGISLTVY